MIKGVRNPSELESQTIEPTRSLSFFENLKSKWGGRTWSRISTNEDGTISQNRIPVSFSESDAAASAFSGCCFSGIMMIVGGIMWGVCKDAPEDGCNPAVKRAGKITFFVGTGLMACDVCCIATIFGIFAATR